MSDGLGAVGSLLGKKRPSVKEEEEQARLKKIREGTSSAQQRHVEWGVEGVRMMSPVSLE